MKLNLNQMESQKIKIELELPLEEAFFLGTFIHCSAFGDLSAQKLLSESGRQRMHLLAQNIIDQVQGKMDMEHLKILNTITRIKSNDFPDEQKDILN
jgi:hypothetical protein